MDPSRYGQTPDLGLGIARRHRPGMASAMGGSGSMRDLAEAKNKIIEKERELFDMTEKRIGALDSKLKQQGEELMQAQAKYKRLKNDFDYNLKLIADRDAELERHDEAFANLQTAIQQRDSQIHALRAQIEQAANKFDAANSEYEENRLAAEARHRELESQLSQLQRRHREHQAKLQAQLDSAKQEAVSRQQAFDMELRSQAQTLKKACETSLTQADAQHRASELASKQQIDSLEARLVKLQLDLEGEQKQKASALINIEQLGLQVEKLQKRIDTDAERAQAEANARTNRIATLEQEKAEIRAMARREIDEANAKHHAVLKDLHEAERKSAVEKQRYEAELAQKQIAKDDSVRDLRSSMDQEVKECQQKLAATELKLHRVQEECNGIRRSCDDQVAAIKAQIESERHHHERTRADFKAAQADWEAEKMRLQQQVAAQRAQVEKVTISHDIMDGNLSSVKHDLKMARNRENELINDASAAAARAAKRWDAREVEHQQRCAEIEAQVEQQRNLFLEAEQKAREQASEFEEKLRQVTEKLHAAQSDIRFAQLLKPVGASTPLRGTNGRAGLASPAFTDDMGPASPGMRGLKFFQASGEDNVLALAKREKEAMELRARLGEVKEENDRYRSVISDMREQMEQLVAQRGKDSNDGGDGGAAAAAAGGGGAAPNGAPPTGAQWAHEKADLEAALRRQEAYGELMQMRLDEMRSEQGGTEGSSAPGASKRAAADLAELTLLRQHNRELTDTVKSLRHQLSQAQSEQQNLRSQLALANARFEEARSDAMQAQDAAKQLIADKAALQTELDTIKANQADDAALRGDQWMDVGTRSVAHASPSSSPSSDGQRRTLPMNLASARILVPHNATPEKPSFAGASTAALAPAVARPAPVARPPGVASNGAWNPAQVPIAEVIQPPQPPPTAPAPGLVWAEPMSVHPTTVQAQPSFAALPPQPPPRPQWQYAAPMQPTVHPFPAAAAPEGLGPPGSVGGESSVELEALRHQVATATKDLDRMVAERGKLLEVSNKLRSDLNRAMSGGAQDMSQAIQQAKAETAAQYEARINEIYHMQQQLVAENRKLSQDSAQNAGKQLPVGAPSSRRKRRPRATAHRSDEPAAGDPAGHASSGFDVQVGLQVGSAARVEPVEDSMEDPSLLRSSGVSASRRYALHNSSGNPYTDDVGRRGGPTAAFRKRMDEVREQLGVQGLPPPVAAGSSRSAAPGHHLPASNSRRSTPSQNQARARVAQQQQHRAAAVSGTAAALRDRAAILAERRRVRNYSQRGE